MEIKMPSYVVKVLEVLEANGFEAYAVGGCVRDSLLGKTPFDWDVCTSALPQEVQRCFADYRTVPTGVKHGTFTVIVEKPIEITTFRIEGDYLDNRHPSGVDFTRSLAEDLCRRDFTVNAMVMDKNGKITDLHGGRADLEQKLIRCVGEAQKRFDEDALRIMRALRFAATLGFELEEKTAEAIRLRYRLLKNISAERITAEMNKLLLGSPAPVMREFPMVFEQIFSEAAIPTELLEKAPCNLHLRLAVMLSRTEGETAAAMLKAMRYDNASIKAVKDMLDYAHLPIRPNKPEMKRLMNVLGFENALRQVEFSRIIGKAPSSEECKGLITQIEQDRECYTLSRLALNGSDIASLKLFRQKDIGKILHILLEKVIDGVLCNTAEALTDYAKTEILPIYELCDGKIVNNF